MRYNWEDLGKIIVNEQLKVLQFVIAAAILVMDREVNSDLFGLLALT